MATENLDEKKPLMARLKTIHRLVIMNHETFEEVGSYKLSLLNVYVAVSTLVVAVALGVTLLIINTPLKRYIPGYGDASQLRAVALLSDKVDDMERQLQANKTYSESFKKVLIGDLETEKDVPKEKVTLPDSLLNVERIQEDEMLRKATEISQGQKSTPASSGETPSTNVSPRDMPLSQMFFVSPLSGEISKGYNLRDHPSVDIIAPSNTPVKAVMDGFVIASDWTLDFGNTIAIQHTNNIVTFYKHNSLLLKKVGSNVKAGEAVAIIGNTGELTNGPHLHFELWHKGKPVNPTEYIKF